MPTVRLRVATLSCAATAALGVSGCGWAQPADADADGPASGAPTSTQPTAPPAVPTGPTLVEVARATLADRSNGNDYSGTVRVTRGEPLTGPPPMGGRFPEDCGLPVGGPARTTTVDVTFADTSEAGMATLFADAELRAAQGGPPPEGVALFIESSAPDARWCQDGTTTPTVDSFGMGTGTGSVTTVSIYVVSRDGAPLTDVGLQISGMRNEVNATGPWDRITAGAANCPGDPAAICVPLG